jgi:LmbE family N-acetylglucosaminyl deacetylase
MAVHAHPDDEATGTGGVLARYASEGVRTVLVTCTDGSCGDGPGGVKPGEPGHDPAAVAVARRRELEESCRVLQVSDLELLGYADSGMMGWATNDAPGSFWTTSVPEAAARLGELISRYEPDVVVTYDPNGFYGHPDHIQAHRVTMAAVAQTGIPAKVYWTTAPRSGIEELFRVFRELAPDHPDVAEGSPDGELPDDFGLPDDQISTWVDTSEFARQKYEALAAHASQEENILFLRIGLERFSELMSMETFVRVQDPTDSPLPEDDLFVGLR